ncbi:MAG: cupredoxin domain-containing protein [Chloroflexota bacterium]|nr:cupredoxin domain-containing protein [Chloroflexota bacterium]
MTEEEPSRDLFSQFLDLLGPLLSPDWNSLILLLPFAMIGLVFLILGYMILNWRRSAGVNRSRVPRRRPGRPPPDVHMPGPSPWPFVAPIGGTLILLSLIFAGEGLPVNPLLFGLGLAVGLVGIAGWYLDAGREWRAAETGGHGGGLGGTLVTGEAVARLPAWAVEPPPGVHMPGPSPWPFFAPIGLFFVFLGLIFGPALLIGGVLMSLVAVIGWYRDAGTEYRQVETIGHVVPETRDPARAWPRSVVPLFGAIAAVALAITFFPLLMSALPVAGGDDLDGGNAGPSPDPAAMIAAESVTSFTKDMLVVPADTPFELIFENRQDGVPHDVAIQGGEEFLFDGEEIIGPETIVYEVPSIPAGEYTFVCTIHPPMTGTLTAQ